uniref:ArdC family protein n=1 Tax=Synechococcus sp. CS-1329 TaxID=2847975 RepID=UPI00223BAD83|nr:ArdC family protein [Synechococcus sp. CS-1329]
MGVPKASTRARSTSRFRSGRSVQASPAEKLVECLIQLLEAGSTPWRREWAASGGGHHINLLSGHRYRGANPILLTLGMHLRGSALPYWCGFAEAKALGIFPGKGSQGIRILRPQVNRSDAEAGGSDTPGSSDAVIESGGLGGCCA